MLLFYILIMACVVLFCLSSPLQKLFVLDFDRAQSVRPKTLSIHTDSNSNSLLDIGVLAYQMPFSVCLFSPLKCLHSAA